MTAPSRPRHRRFCAAFLGDRSGVAAVEFALISPTIILVLVGLIDLGGMLYTRFQLDAALNAAANYAQVNAANVSSTNGATLASTLAQLAASPSGSSSSVTINDGPTASYSTSTGTAATSSGGTASNADSCYCPTGSGTSVTFGSSQTCGSTCSGGGYAGKFVQLSASMNYSPIFSGYGLVSQAGTMQVSTVVQVQ